MRKQLSWYQVAISILAILLVHACSATRLNQKFESGNGNETNLSPDIDRDHQVVALVFIITKPTAESKDSIRMSKCTISPGLLKEDITLAPTMPPGKWRCSFLNEKYEVIKSVVLDDPLIRHHEYITIENGQESFGNKTLQLQKASFIVRARYDATFKYTLLEKTDANGNPFVNTLFEILPNNL